MQVRNDETKTMITSSNPETAMILRFPARPQNATGSHPDGMAGVSAAVIPFPGTRQPAPEEVLCAAALDNCWYHDEALKAGS